MADGMQTLFTSSHINELTQIISARNEGVGARLEFRFDRCLNGIIAQVQILLLFD